MAAAGAKPTPVNCRTATGVELGLLLSFGTDTLEFKPKHGACRPRQETEGRRDQP